MREWLSRTGSEQIGEVVAGGEAQEGASEDEGIGGLCTRGQGLRQSGAGVREVIGGRRAEGVAGFLGLDGAEPLVDVDRPRRDDLLAGLAGDVLAAEEADQAGQQQGRGCGAGLRPGPVSGRIRRR